MAAIPFEDDNKPRVCSARIKFNLEGDVVGVLHIGSDCMHLFSIYNQKTKKIGDSFGTVIDDFALAPDFSLDRTESQLLVTANNVSVTLWDCSAKDPIVLRYRKRETVLKGLSMLPDYSSVVICEEPGDLVWYDIEKAREEEERRKAEAGEHDDRPLLPSAGRSVDAGQVWKQGTGFFRYFVEHLKQSFYEPSTYFIWEEAIDHIDSELKEAQGSLACRFSTDGKTAVLMSEISSAYVWDLVKRVLVAQVVNELRPDAVEGIPVWPLISMDGSMDVTDKIINDSNVLANVDYNICGRIIENKKLQGESSVVVSEKGHTFLFAGSAGSDQNKRLKPSSNDLLVGRRDNTCDTIFVVDALDRDLTRELKAARLQPWKGMAISMDGRAVACLSSGTKLCHLCVWNAYACHDLVPSFYALSKREWVYKKELVDAHIPPMLRQFGTNLLNYVRPHGKTFLFDALDAVNDEVLDVALKYAHKKGIKVSLEDKDPKEENAVQIAIRNRSPEIASLIMKYMRKRVTHVPQMSRVLKRCLVLLNKTYPRIFLTALHSIKLFCEDGPVRVPESMMGSDSFLEATSDNLYVDGEQTDAIWEERCKARNEEERGEDPITVMAMSMVLPYPDACQLGREGLLRSLLVSNVNDACFGSFAIKAIVQYKWRTYAGAMFFIEFLHYVCLLGTFTIYSFFLVDQDTCDSDADHCDENNTIYTATSFAFCWMLTLPKLFVEISQSSFYWIDYKFKGIYYWLTTSWNWIELICYGVIVVVIPVSNYSNLNKGNSTKILSAIVAVESILLWYKLLYFARPFQQTGPLVITVAAIARDIMPFLFLFSCITFGFAMAFYVLYRHIRPEDSCDGPCDDTTEDIIFSFGTFPKTMFTVMGYIFGDFDSAVLFNAPVKEAAICLFVLYMVIVMIILLNMLIAIMTDSFERIKSKKDVQFIKARAEAIDDMESMLSKKRKESQHGKLGKYLHVAVPQYRLGNIVGRGGRGTSDKDGRKSNRKKIGEILKLLTAMQKKTTAEQIPKPKLKRSVSRREAMAPEERVEEEEQSKGQASGSPKSSSSSDGSSSSDDSLFSLD